MGNADMNGWYRCFEAAERRKPRAYGPWLTIEKWTRNRQGRPWYEKDDGCFMYGPVNGSWVLHNGRGKCCYMVRSDPSLPSDKDWIAGAAKAPLPTLRFVYQQSCGLQYHPSPVRRLS